MTYENSSAFVIERDPARQLFDDMLKYFDKLPDPDQEPIRFRWFCKLYQFQMKQKGIDIVFPKSETKLDVRV